MNIEEREDSRNHLFIACSVALFLYAFSTSMWEKTRPVETQQEQTLEEWREDFYGANITMEDGGTDQELAIPETMIIWETVSDDVCLTWSTEKDDWEESKC